VSNIHDSAVIDEYADLLQDELNVKNVRALSAASEAAAYELVPLPKQLGQKYKDQFPAVRKAILLLDPEQAAGTLLKGESLKVPVDGEEYEILPEEVEVRMQAKEGFEVASDGAYVAALVTKLSDALVDEGLVREFVRRVQEARKQADFEIADRIRLVYSCSDKLKHAIETFKDYIMDETLAVELDGEQVLNILPNLSDEFDGETLTIWLEKA
jgi:isoleucyl-tRNA synthetase